MTTDQLERPVPLLHVTEVVDLSKVADNPWQPRLTIDEAKVQELAESIREMGLQQLPKVRPVEGGWQICFGHMRIKALRLLGFDSYELEVGQLTDTEMALLALTENSKRTDVAQIEQFRAWQKCLEIEGMTPAVLAVKIGVNIDTITGNLRLLKLPRFVLEHVDSGEMAPRAAREFLCLMGEDHFHEEEAKVVIRRLETGAPDWRQARVRWELNHEIEGKPVAEWRKLWHGKKGVTETGLPLFDVTMFKATQEGKVHTVANDEWADAQGRGAYILQDLQRSKVKSERSRDWTCATSAWNRAQTTAKKSAEGVATAGAKKAGDSKPGKSSDFVKVLASDPVFKTVDPSTAGPLLKSMKAGALDEDAARALGTRAAAVELERGEGTFKAAVDEENPFAYQGTYGLGLTRVPSYFPDINECRKTCTIGAAYGRFDGRGSYSLYCVNKDHFEEKVAKGGLKVTRELDKVRRDVEEKEAAAVTPLLALTSGLPASVVRLLAAVLVREHTRFSTIRPKDRTMGWEDALKLRQLTANVERLMSLLDAQLDGHDDIDMKKAITALVKLDDATTWELVARMVVEASSEAELAALVNTLEAPVT